MTFRELLGGLSKQRVLVNANSFEGRYAVGEFVTLGDDFISIVFVKEAVHYPIARVLEVSTAKDGSCYVPTERGSRVEVQPDVEGSKNPLVLIRLSETR